MIRPLRRVHPWLVAGVSLAAGTVSLLALRDRPPPPVADLPPPLASPSVSPAGDWQVLLAAESTIRVRREGDELLVRTEGVLEVPEPRLLWIPSRDPDSGADLGELAGDPGAPDEPGRSLEGAARPLVGGGTGVPLGGLRGRGTESFPAPSGEGRLILTSLGHGEVLAELTLDGGGED